MAGFQDYSTGAVYINGQLLAEAASISISRKTGAIANNTLAKGFAGMSPGVRMMEVKVTSAVPRVGLEYDPGAVMNGLVPVEFAAYVGSKTITTKGYVTEDDMKVAVNAETTIDMSIMCAYAEWQ